MRPLPLLALCLGSLACAQQTRPPNLILVSMDGLRASRAGSYGNPHQPTPTLDRLAADGIRWEYSFSQSNESLFSHAALLSGRHVPELGLPDYRTFVVTEEAVLLGEVLAAYGYATAAFVAGGHVHASYGFEQGFGAFDDSHDFGGFFHKAPQALAWVGERPREPFFLFLHGYDCHRPYFHPGPWYHAFDAGYEGDVDALMMGRGAVEQVYDGRFYPDFPLERFAHLVGDPIVDPEGYMRIRRWAAEHEGVPLSEADMEHLRAHYDSGALAADLQVGLFLAELEARDLLANTWVLLTADHGEDLGDHGFFNHRAVLRDSTTRVPMVLWSPQLAEDQRGTVRQDLAQAIDVLPTLLTLAGATWPAGLSGRDLLAPPPPEQPAPERQVFQVGVLPELSLRSPTHRLVFRGVPPAFPMFSTALAAAPLEEPWFQLFDLQLDPEEQEDVLAEQRAMARQMKADMLQWYQGLQLSGQRGQPPQDPDLLEALRARGYW